MEQMTFKFRDKPDPLWCSWFVGFCDGEAYFQIMPTRKYLRVSLTITLREDDEDIIKEIHKILNCGRIYYISYKHARKQGQRASNQWRWRLTHINQIINNLLPVFNEYPLKTKKRFDYEIWREAALILYNKLHLTPNGNRRLEELYEQMKELHKIPFYELGYKIEI